MRPNQLAINVPLFTPRTKINISIKVRHADLNGLLSCYDGLIQLTLKRISPLK